jgi:hypothetical protein
MSLRALFVSIVSSELGSRIVFCTFPGLAGGFVLFLDGLRAGRYRNNRYFAKAIIEMAGAALMATFLSYELFGLRPSAAFAVGIGWAAIIQVIRKKITRIVSAVIGEHIDA